MNKLSVNKIAGFIIIVISLIYVGFIGPKVSAAGAPGPAVDANDGASTGTAGCQVTSAQFDPGQSPGDMFTWPGYTKKFNHPSQDFYSSLARPLININITTQNCVNIPIYVSLLSKHSNIPYPIGVLNNKKLIIPNTNTLNIQLSAGTTECKLQLGTDPNCDYYIAAGPTILPVGTSSDDINKIPGYYYSYNKQKGELAYDWTVISLLTTPDSWKYISDTGASSDGVAVTLQSAGTTDSCTGKTDCYQLYSGLSDIFGAFGTKLSVITQATSLGSFLNAIIAVIIGFAGLAAVLRIMYLGVIYMRTDKITEKLTVRGAIVQTVGGFILILLIYTILRTINPDLLNLTPRIDQVLEQIQQNSPTNSANKSSDESQAVIVSPGITGYATNPTKNISQYDSFFSASSSSKGVDCTLMKADMYIESGGNPNAVSSAKARGLMQIMPAVAQTFNVSFDSMFDPKINIETSSKLWQYNYLGACNGAKSNAVCNTNDIKYIIAANSAGAGANKPSNTCPGKTQWECTSNAGFQETRDYIPKVTSAYNILKQNNWGCQ